MLKATLISLLLLPLVLTGCLQSQAEPPISGTAEPGAGPLHWKERIENDTYLIRIEASESVTIKKYQPEWPEQLFHTVFVVLGEEWPLIHARRGPPPLVAIQNESIGPPVPLGPSAPSSNPEADRTYPAGTHHVILDSKGDETTFTITSDNASLEVIATGPRMGDYRWHYDDKWDYHKRIYCCGGRQILDASTNLPLFNNFSLTWLSAGDDPWDIDLDPVCDLQTQGYPHGSQEWWIIHDGPLDVRIRTSQPFSGAFFVFYTMDLPLEVPKETGCWTADEWKEPNS